MLHDLLVYMLMVGLDPQRTMELIQRFAAQTRLAIGEERLLQQTLKHIEKCIEENVSKSCGHLGGDYGIQYLIEISCHNVASQSCINKNIQGPVIFFLILFFSFLFFFFFFFSFFFFV